MQKCDVVIVGAGPAGLFSAINCAGTGRKVVILEKTASAGNKLLLSGAGKCNVTHEGDIRDFFPRYGANGKFLKSALMNFSNTDLVDFFADRKLKMRLKKHGKLFPDSLESEDIRDVLLRACKGKGVRIKYSEPVRSVKEAAGGFEVRTAIDTYTSGYLVLATGGKSYPSTGSSGDGYILAKKLGHDLTEIWPSLTPIHIRDHPFKDLARIAFKDITVSLYRDNRKLKDLKGHMILSRLGLSGPVIMNLSRYARKGDVIKLSFIDAVNKKAFADELVKKCNISGTKRVKNILAEYEVPERVIRRVMEMSGVSIETTGASLDKKGRNLLVENLTACPLVVKGLGDFDIAMVTKGGVSLDEVNPKTMGSRVVQGLYIVGELLDIDGDTGGYNIQAAFSTAKLAADDIVKRG